MNTTQLADCLRAIATRSLPGPLPFAMGGIFREGPNDPDASTPMDSYFYLNNATNGVFYQAFDGNGWELVQVPILVSQGQVLTAKL